VRAVRAKAHGAVQVTALHTTSRGPRRWQSAHDSRRQFSDRTRHRIWRAPGPHGVGPRFLRRGARECHRRGGDGGKGVSRRVGRTWREPSPVVCRDGSCQPTGPKGSGRKKWLPDEDSNPLDFSRPPRYLALRQVWFTSSGAQSAAELPVACSNLSSSAGLWQNPQPSGR